MFLYTRLPADRPLGASIHPCGKSARPTGQDIAVQVPLSKASLPLDNKLLASLPRDHFDRLLPNLVSVNLPQGQVLNEAGDEVDQVYFPQNGIGDGTNYGRWLPPAVQRNQSAADRNVRKG